MCLKFNLHKNAPFRRVYFSLPTDRAYVPAGVSCFKRSWLSCFNWYSERLLALRVLFLVNPYFDHFFGMGS